MREQLRNELLVALGENMGAEDLRAAERAIDAVISRYDVRPAETHLEVLGREEMERLIKTYIVVRRMEGLSETTLANYYKMLHLFMGNGDENEKPRTPGLTDVRG